MAMAKNIATLISMSFLCQNAHAGIYEDYSRLLSVNENETNTTLNPPPPPPPADTGSNANNTGSGTEAAGCYDTVAHKCDCEVNEAACTGMWTTRCAARCFPANNTNATNTGSGASMATGPAGCYDMQKHVCDCTVDEAECTGETVTWAKSGCNSCEKGGNETEATTASPPTPLGESSAFQTQVSSILAACVLTAVAKGGA